MTAALPPGGHIGLLTAARAAWEAPLLAAGCRPRRRCSAWLLLQRRSNRPPQRSPSTEQRRHERLRLLKSAAHHHDWPLVAEAGGPLFAGPTPWQNPPPTVATALIAYIEALYQLRRYSGVRRVSRYYQPWLLRSTAAADLRRWTGLYLEALLRLELPEEAQTVATTLPHTALSDPAVSTCLQQLLAEDDPEQALAWAQHALAHTRRRKARHLGRLAAALERLGTPPTAILQHVAAWAAVKSARGADLPRLGWLHAALHARLGDSPQALAALNRELHRHQLAPLCRRDPQAPLSVDNVTAATSRNDTSNSDATANSSAPEPLISVIMSAFNAAATIDTAIASVVGQHHRNWELIVVDDGSSDATLARARAWQQRDSRVRVIGMAANCGVYRTRNVALQHARGDYLTTLDADDWSHPEQLQRLLATLESHGTVAAIAATIRLADNGAIQLQAHGPVLKKNLSSLLFKRSVFDRLGFFQPIASGAGADREYEARIKTVYGPRGVAAATDLCLTLARWHPVSLTASGPLARSAFGRNRLQELFQRLTTEWQQQCLRTGRTPRIEHPDRLPQWLPHALRGPDQPLPHYTLY